MRYLVTGALGAIGAWTVRSLLDRGHVPVTYDLDGSDHRLRLALTGDELAGLTRVTGDVTDLAALESVIDEHDVTSVIHLAALQVPFVKADLIAGAEVNVLGTVNVLEAVRRRGERMRPVVYASSIAALAEPGGYPSTLYGVFKLANEGTAERYFQDFGVPRSACGRTPSYGPAATRDSTSALLDGDGRGRRRAGVRHPFGGLLQLQYVADVGERIPRASEVVPRRRVRPQYGWAVASMPQVIAAIEAAAPIRRDDRPPAISQCRCRRGSTRPRSSSSSDRMPARSAEEWPRRSRGSALYRGADLRDVKLNRPATAWRWLT